MTDDTTHAPSPSSGLIEHAFGGYRIDVKRGSTSRLIVSLAGIGVPDGDRPGRPSMALEWNGTFARLALRDHVVFLRDLNRSWFNDEDGWDDVVAFIQRYCASHGIVTRLGIGLSMGGSGLLILDRDIRFDHAIVMGPQVLLGNDVCTWDRRFADLWAEVRHFRHPDLGAVMRDDSHIHVLCPIDIAEDVLHVRRLVQRRSTVRVSFVHGDHNIGSEMGRRAALDRYVKAVIDQDDAALRSVGVFDADRRVFDLTDRWMTEGCTPEIAAAVAAVCRASPSNVPEFLAPLLTDNGAPSAPFDGFDRDGTDEPLHVVHAAQIVPPAAFPRLARYGWFGLENGEFLWSKGTYHVLRLHVVDFADFPDTKVVLTLAPLLGSAHRRQIISIAVDGVPVVDRTFSHEADGRGPVEIRLPIGRARPEILLTTPLCVSPHDMGLNEDTRLLAFQLMGIKLLPF